MVESLFSAEAKGWNNHSQSEEIQAAKDTSAEFVVFKKERDKVVAEMKVMCSKERQQKLDEVMRQKLKVLVPKVFLQRRGCDVNLGKHHA